MYDMVTAIYNTVNWTLLRVELEHSYKQVKRVSKALIKLL